MKVAVLTTHPIQYQVPWLRLLSEQEGVDLTVFFCLLPDDTQQGVGFGVAFQWDIPLLNGYHYRVLDNVAANPSVTQFKGCDTPEIYRILRDEKFDALIVNGWVVKSCLQALWACRRLGIPCIVRGESNALRPRAGWKQHLHHLLLKQYAAFLAIGRSNRQFYLDRGVPAQRIFMAPYCIDNAFFSEQAEVLKPERATIRAEWGLPDDAVVFLFVGKFEEKKRPKFLIDAFRSVASPAYLLMVGSGDLLEECQEAVQADNLPVRFTGFMNQGQIPRAYAAADVLLLPSDYGETWGLVVNEAMACGLPAVVSNHVGSHPDLIEAGKTGYTYPMDDVAALRERIDALTHDPTHIQTMGAQAVEKISNFTFDHVLSGVMEALAYCVGENGGRAS